MIDIRQFVTDENRPGSERPTFAVRPTQMYPAMIAHIAEVLADETLAPNKYVDLKGSPNALAMYYDEAKALPKGALELALIPYSKTGELNEGQKRARNAALECARKWFTELLHQSIGGKAMGVHILAEDFAFRLC